MTNFEFTDESIHTLPTTVYNLSKNFSELLWYNQFDHFQPPHPNPAGGGFVPNESPWIRHCSCSKSVENASPSHSLVCHWMPAYITV